MKGYALSQKSSFQYPLCCKKFWRDLSCLACYKTFSMKSLTWLKREVMNTMLQESPSECGRRSLNQSSNWIQNSKRSMYFFGILCFQYTPFCPVLFSTSHGSNCWSNLEKCLTYFGQFTSIFCSYIKGLDYDPDRERAQMKKMRKRVKSEMKGAKRELQKDNYFLAAVKEKERRKRDEERAEMYGKAMAFLQEQENAFKSGQLGKGKGRKRRRWYSIFQEQFGQCKYTAYVAPCHLVCSSSSRGTGGSRWLLYCELRSPTYVCPDYKSRGSRYPLLVLWSIPTCLKLCLEHCNATNTLQGFSLVNYHTWQRLYFSCTVELLSSVLYWCHSNFRKHSEEFFVISIFLVLYELLALWAWQFWTQFYTRKIITITVLYYCLVKNYRFRPCSSGL